MEGELTLEMLDEAIAKIKQFERDNEVIGFKVNPDDLREIKEGTMCISGVVNNSLFMTPPYQCFRLFSDINQPRGYVEAVRKTDPIIPDHQSQI